MDLCRQRPILHHPDSLHGRNRWTIVDGTWPQGYVLRLEASGAWTTTGRLGIPKGLFECNEVMDLRVYNGKFYATLILKS